MTKNLADHLEMTEIKMFESRLNAIRKFRTMLWELRLVNLMVSMLSKNPRSLLQCGKG